MKEKQISINLKIGICDDDICMAWLHLKEIILYSLLYKKKYICKENWYGGKSKKIVFKKYKLVKWILIKKI